jgi:rhamnose transport system permease protein
VLIAGLPVPVVIFVVASVGLGLVLGTTIYGRQIYQIGTNEVAARYAGIRTRAIKMALFLAMGFAGAAAGMIFTSRLGSVRYDLGLGGELQMVLMAMLGAPTSSVAAARSSEPFSPHGFCPSSRQG